MLVNSIKIRNHFYQVEIGANRDKGVKQRRLKTTPVSHTVREPVARTCFIAGHKKINNGTLCKLF